jgi:tRNA-(ms[2]io[6]A)-hydroxylase
MAQRIAELPLLSRTPIEWGRAALNDTIALLSDHAILEKKAANNAMQMLTHWPSDWSFSGAQAGIGKAWAEVLSGVARDEGAHLAQVVRILTRRGGHLQRVHVNPYANALNQLVRKGQRAQTLDHLFVSALIEARSCERFGVLTEAAQENDRDPELAAFFGALFSSELGHYKVFLKLAYKIEKKEIVDAEWHRMLVEEARILAEQPPGPRIHSGF